MYLPSNLLVPELNNEEGRKSGIYLEDGSPFVGLEEFLGSGT